MPSTQNEGGPGGRRRKEQKKERSNQWQQRGPKKKNINEGRTPTQMEKHTNSVKRHVSAFTSTYPIHTPVHETALDSRPVTGSSRGAGQRERRGRTVRRFSHPGTASTASPTHHPLRRSPRGASDSGWHAGTPHQEAARVGRDTLEPH